MLVSSFGGNRCLRNLTLSAPPIGLQIIKVLFGHLVAVKVEASSFVGESRF